MKFLPIILILIGCVCFIFTLLRNAFGRPSKLNAIDYIALVGMWLCPWTWVIYGVIQPIAKTVDYLNESDFKRKLKEDEARKDRAP